MKIGIKEIEIKKFITRKIDREYKELLTGDNALDPNKPQLKVKDMEKANNYLVLSMTNLTQDEIDEMDKNDFDKLFNQINLLNNTPTVA